MIDVMTELEPIGALFAGGKHRDGLTRLSELWDRIPVPKEALNNAHLIVAYGVVLAQKDGDLDLAWEWAQRAMVFSGSVNLMGESEFLVGEVAYARGDLEQAKHYFLITKKNSGKRLFQDKNPEYWELIR
jgi:hypothetical protein